MKLELLDFLCCPVCGGDLKLNSFREERAQMVEGPGTEPGGACGCERVIREGVLACAQCRVWYPILEYVPVMLAFPTRVHRRFAEKHPRQMGTLSGYTMPKGIPSPGEKSVQETFSDEWARLPDDELSFIFTADDLVELNQQVWLKPLQRT